MLLKKTMSGFLGRFTYELCTMVSMKNKGIPKQWNWSVRQLKGGHVFIQRLQTFFKIFICHHW